MALSEGTPTLINSDAVQPRIRKIDTDKAIVVYDDVTNGRERAVIVDISSGSISVGSENDVWDTERLDDADIWTISTTKVVLFGEPADTTDAEIRTLSISGNTVTEQTVEIVESGITATGCRLAMISGGTGLVAYWKGSHALCRFTVTGDTIAAGTVTAHTETGIPRGMCKLDSSRVFYFYHTSGDEAKVQVIDISSSISQGTPSAVDSQDIDQVQSGWHTVGKLDTNKVICLWFNNETDEVNAVVVTTDSGTGIDTVGTVFTVASGASADRAHSLDIIDSTTVLITYIGAGSAEALTLNISGTTITSNADDVTLTRTSGVGDGADIAIVDSDQALYVVTENITNDLYVSIISGFSAAAASDELRYLGLSSDQTNLYISQMNGGTLQFTYSDLETLTMMGTSSFGTAAFADIDTNTYGIYPVAKPNEEQVLYLRGRDGNDLQVQYNNLDGTLGWTDVGPGTATWGVTKFAVALTPDPMLSDDITVFFSDDDVYRTEEGTQNWTKMGDASTGLRAGLRFATSNHEHLVGGTAAGTVEYTPNYGVSFSDISGTVLGTINWFEESR